MTESIKKIFNQNINLLSYSDKTITYIRMQNYYMALEYSTKTIDAIMFILVDIINNVTYFNELDIIVSIEGINQMLNNLLEAQEMKDYILLADLYELQLNPFILKLQETVINKEKFVFDQGQYDKNLDLIMRKDFKLAQQLRQKETPLIFHEKEYSVEYTSSGLMTIALYDNDKKYYLHSNGQVLHEAGILAREWFSDDVSEYNIYGLGFGYHIKELMDLDDSIVINVYESDMKIINLACAFTDMNRILISPRVNLIYDPHFERLGSKMNNVSESTRYIIHYPSLRNIKNIKIREHLEDYFITYSSINNQLHKLNNNFRLNITRYDEYVDALKKKFAGKTMYIIAAGPSLDKNYLKLKDIGEDSIICATGTVFKKMLMADIIPDYVIIIDANEPVHSQIKDVSTTNIPLIYLSTVYHKIPMEYKGKRYLICQEGYKKAEEYANKNGYSLYQTGGSVSTTALDIGIKFGCKKIIFLGLDLAYTNNLDHASGTASVNTVESYDLRKVKGINGDIVNTCKNLDIYRKWIERRIKGEEGIEFIDATEGGAKIQGMKTVTLRELLG